MKRPSSRCGSPAFGMIERGGSSGPASPIAFRASIEALGPAPQLTPTTSAPADAIVPATRSAVAPSNSVRSSPNVREAMTGMSAALRASSSAISSCSRSENVSSTTTSIPPSSRPSSCSRNIARASCSEERWPCRIGGASGPTEPPTSASLPLTSRASRATWAARRFSRPTSPSSPNSASRRRFAPSDSVSISSAPASRYSRWAAPTSSGRLVASSSRQALCGTPRLYMSVPMPPSARSGR